MRRSFRYLWVVGALVLSGNAHAVPLGKRFFSRCIHYIHFVTHQEKPPFQPLSSYEVSTKYLDLKQALWKEQVSYLQNGSARPLWIAHVYQELEPLVKIIREYLDKLKNEKPNENAKSIEHFLKKIDPYVQKLEKYKESKEKGLPLTSKEVAFFVLWGGYIKDSIKEPLQIPYESHLELTSSMEVIFDISESIFGNPNVWSWIPYSEKVHWMELNRTVPEALELLGISNSFHNFYDGMYDYGYHSFSMHDFIHVKESIAEDTFYYGDFSIENYNVRKKFLEDYLRLSKQVSKTDEDGYYAEAFFFINFREFKSQEYAEFLNSGKICECLKEYTKSASFAESMEDLVDRLKDPLNMGEGLGKYSFSRKRAGKFFQRMSAACVGK